MITLLPDARDDIDDAIKVVKGVLGHASRDILGSIAIKEPLEEVFAELRTDFQVGIPNE